MGLSAAAAEQEERYLVTRRVSILCARGGIDTDYRATTAIAADQHQQCVRRWR